MATKKTRKKTQPSAAETIVNSGASTLREVDEAEGADAAQHVLMRMQHDGVSDRELLLQIAECPNQELLFQQLRNAHKGRKSWWRFVETTFLLPEEVWEQGGGSMEETLVRTLSGLDLLKRLAKPGYPAHREMRRVLTSKYHPLFNVLSFDDYWSEQVRHYIRGRDAKRAWDAMRAAFRGFRISDIEPDPEDLEKEFWENPAHRCCRASKALLRQLVDELFTALCEDEVIESLKDSDYLAPRDIKDVRKTLRNGSVTFVTRQNYWQGRALVHAIGTVRSHYEAKVGGGVTRRVSRIGGNAYEV
ncbi:hypothetical protein GF380_03085, partial [Candidatus Uhrbacteria bacterium]|nr:hypothetical protein [Candidatus Uhrbacteria bacterium]MBD3284128.1 hypothetical protein [Candidatus Uhrbacteria bacterium]